jgi:hypothetical protein
VTLSADSLNNQDLWTDMTATMFSPPLREINGGVRSEILVFLSFCLPREELTVNLLKAKNMGGLFPAYIGDETGGSKVNNRRVIYTAAKKTRDNSKVEWILQ